MACLTACLEAQSKARSNTQSKTYLKAQLKAQPKACLEAHSKDHSNDHSKAHLKVRPKAGSLLVQPARKSGLRENFWYKILHADKVPMLRVPEKLPKGRQQRVGMLKPQNHRQPNFILRIEKKK